MIKTTNLSCGYSHTIINNISFECEGNLVILGANGVGKSTLAKALCALIPYEGSIVLNHKALENYTPKERAKQITYIPPKLTSFDTYITAEAFILMGRFPHKSVLHDYSKEDKKLAKKLLNDSGISPEQYLSELSSGQQQLVLIAQALAQESHSIIFDEPTANLDPQHAHAFYKTLKNLPANRQKIVITHDLQFAVALKYPVLFLHHEEVRYFKDPNDFFTPQNLEVCYGVAFKRDNHGLGVIYE